MYLKLLKYQDDFQAQATTLLPNEKAEKYCLSKTVGIIV